MNPDTFTFLLMAVVFIVLTLTVAGVILLKPVSHRLGFLLEAMAREKNGLRSGAEVGRIQALLEAVGARVSLHTGRRQSTKQGSRGMKVSPDIGLRHGVCLLLPYLLLSGCSEDPTAPELTRESEHFRFVAEAGNATQAELEQGVQLAEAHRAAIVGVLGAERVSNRTITVVLNGPVGPCRANRVDEEGRILLCRVAAQEGGYYAVFAHELTHALRYEFWGQHGTWEWPSFGYFEDGFAEFVALLVDPSKTGFPFYGYPEDVVAGYWVVSGQAIPNEVLRPRNQEINSPCQFQAYPQRASWFRYIDETFGRAAVLAVAYSEVEVTSTVALSLLGVGLAEVDSGWEQWVSARYAAIADADGIAQQYRRRVPDSSVCVEGVDY